MSGNVFGNCFRIATWGESHGPAIGVVIDGCPAGLPLSAKDIQRELDRRKPGQSAVTSARKEADAAEILSGVFEGKTTGTPISLLVRNSDAKSGDYDKLKTLYRPSHADYAYDAKYGFRDHRGGGRASARETVGRVAAGAIAKKILAKQKMEIVAYVSQIHHLCAAIDPAKVSAASVEKNIVRCPDPVIAKKMIAHIGEIQKKGDSVGGVITCVIRNAPAGLGSPVFDKLEARLAHGMLSLPAVKGFEIGSGFGSVLMTGSTHNDPMTMKNGKVITKTNHAGGIAGGISNGMDIVFRVAFKPTATIFQKQETVGKNGKNTTLQIAGRHDPCVVPRAVPIVEAMAALVLADEMLIQKTVIL